jgi:hypothetical protein
MTENMSGTAQFVLFALIGTGVLAGLGDAYTTQLGFGVELVEGNPIARWLQKKLGFGLSVFAAISAFVLTASFASVVSPLVAQLYAGGITALETFNTIRNYKLYKQAAAFQASLKKK